MATRTIPRPSKATCMSADVAASADVRKSGWRSECGCPRMWRRPWMSVDVAASAVVAVTADVALNAKPQREEKKFCLEFELCRHFCALKRAGVIQGQTRPAQLQSELCGANIMQESEVEQCRACMTPATSFGGQSCMSQSSCDVSVSLRSPRRPNSCCPRKMA
jgi:hypothetical protein